jgi:hypothetical protein
LVSNLSGGSLSLVRARCCWTDKLFLAGWGHVYPGSEVRGGKEAYRKYIEEGCWGGVSWSGEACAVLRGLVSGLVVAEIRGGGTERGSEDFGYWRIRGEGVE